MCYCSETSSEMHLQNAPLRLSLSIKSFFQKDYSSFLKMINNHENQKENYLEKLLLVIAVAVLISVTKIKTHFRKRSHFSPAHFHRTTSWHAYSIGIRYFFNLSNIHKVKKAILTVTFTHKLHPTSYSLHFYNICVK